MRAWHGGMAQGEPIESIFYPWGFNRSRPWPPPVAELDANVPRGAGLHTARADPSSDPTAIRPCLAPLIVERSANQRLGINGLGKRCARAEEEQGGCEGDGSHGGNKRRE